MPLGPPTTSASLTSDPARLARIRRRLYLHPALAVFVAAFSIRFVAALILRIKYGGSVFSDDLLYTTMAQQAADGHTAGWDTYTSWLYSHTRTFLWPLTAVYAVAGGEPLSGQALVAVCGAATAAAAARLTLLVARVPYALFAGLAVALFPSQVLWSSITLKDAFIWMLVSGIAVALAKAFAASGRVAVVAWACVVLLLVLIDGIRPESSVVASLSVGLAGLLGIRRTDLRRSMAAMGLAILVAVAVPWSLALGPAGEQLASSRSGDLASHRMLEAENAATAVISKPLPAARSTPSPAPRASGGSSGTHATPGTTPASPPTETSKPPVSGAFAGTDGTTTGNLVYLPRGLSVVILQPWPWATAGNWRVKAALAEHLLWYPMLMLALLALPTVVRRREVLAYPLVVGVGIATLYALSEGNFGTAYRHRSELVWVAACLAAVGLQWVVDRLRDRRTRSQRLGGRTAVAQVAQPVRNQSTVVRSPSVNGTGFAAGNSMVSRD